MQGGDVPGFGTQIAALTSDEPLDLYTEKILVNVVNAVKASGPLASYAAIAMTLIGAKWVSTIFKYYLCHCQHYHHHRDHNGVDDNDDKDSHCCHHHQHQYL